MLDALGHVTAAISRQIALFAAVSISDMPSNIEVAYRNENLAALNWEMEV